MMNYKVLALCLVLLGLCHTLTADPYYACELKTEGGTTVPCSEVFENICPDLSNYNIECLDDADAEAEADCSALIEPVECITPEWKCNPVLIAEDDTTTQYTAEKCANDVRTNWNEVDTADAGKITFTRVVDECTPVKNYLEQDVGCDDETKPIASIQATRSLTTQCRDYSATDETLQWTTCPDTTADDYDFSKNDVDQLKYCSGLDAGLKQQCSFSITATTPATAEDSDPVTVFNFVETAQTCPTDSVIDVTCPVYSPRCVDPYLLKKDDDAGEESDIDDNEMTPAVCAAAKPTCPTCTPDYLKLANFDVATAKAGILVRCYVLTVVSHDDNESELDLTHHDEEEKYVLKTDLSPEQYKLCLRAGAFAADPQQVEPTATCPALNTCAYYKCLESQVDPVWSFESCYNDDDAEIVCTRNGKGFPECTGNGTKDSKCYLGGELQNDSNACQSYTGYDLPILTDIPCKPNNCPAFVWVTDVTNPDEKDTDYGEEETSSEVYLALDMTTITASLNNVDLTSLTWSVKLYQRDVSVDETTSAKSYKYTHLSTFDKTGLSKNTETIVLTAANAPIGTYFVLRAEYDEYTMITEEDSGDCEILDVKNVYPTNPAKCDEKAVEPFITQDDKDDDVTKQGPGREKLGLMVTHCHVELGDDCKNGSICQGVETTVEGKDEKVMVYQCSACEQGWTGDVCGTCHLTGVCKNGSTPYGQDLPASFRYLHDGHDDDNDSSATAPSADGTDEEPTDESYNGQCRCECSRANVGPLCQCNAFYTRITFKNQLESNTDTDQWLKRFVTEVAAVSTLDPNVFAVVSNELNNPKKNTNHVVLSIAACDVPQSMLMQQLDTLATYTPYSQARVESSWAVYRTGNQNSPSAKQVGGVHAVSQVYNPSCTGECNVADPTSSSYEVPSDDKVDSSSKAGWIILGILIALAVIIIIFALCVKFLKNNKKKNFGSDDGLDMSELS